MSESSIDTGTIFDEFCSPENFQLAWERVRYFDRPDSRDWIGLKIFAANRDHNIEILRQSVIDRVFEPSYPEVKYFPKPSMTLRPMAMLPVPDRIVLQAIGNVIANRGRAKLSVVANKQSFANVLAADGVKHLFSHWKNQYRLFQDKYLELVEDGNIWVAETDAAAFYETIDHHRLFDILSTHSFLDEPVLSHLENYMPIWCSVRRGQAMHRGIPQGCLTSDLLANVFLYEFDREFATSEYYYLRYVDDIRLLGKTKPAVQRGLISVDMAIKSLGLLLQTNKTTVRKVKDRSLESERLAAQLSEIDSRLRNPEVYVIDTLNDPLLSVRTHVIANIDDEEELPVEPELSGSELAAEFGVSEEDTSSFLTLIEQVYQDLMEDVQKELLELYWTALKSLEDADSPFSERHLRFALYRLSPDAEITNSLKDLFTDRPWLCNIIEHYLNKADFDPELIEYLNDVIATHDVYDNIVAASIKLLGRKQISMRKHHPLFRKWVLDETKQWYLREASILALGESEDNLSVLLKCFTSTSPFVRRMALIQALTIAKTTDDAIHIAVQAVDDTSPDLANTLVHLIYDEWGMSLADIQTPDQLPSEHILRYAKGYDQSLPTIQSDYIRHIFRNRYNLQLEENIDFRSLLGDAYERAAEYLWHAERSYLQNPSRYVSQLDLFHEELLYPILVQKLRVKNTYAELAQVEFTNRIEMLRSNESQLGTFVGAISHCRRLRANPETHSRLHRQLNFTEKITSRERDRLRRQLSGGYQEFVHWLESDSEQSGCSG